MLRLSTLQIGLSVGDWEILLIWVWCDTGLEGLKGVLLMLS